MSQTQSTQLLKLPRLKDFVESRFFERFVTALIILNAATLGLETYQGLSPTAQKILNSVDQIFLGFFTMELILRGIVYRTRFFNDPWRCFDFTIVSIALLPSSGAFSVLRSLRILRTLRMVSVVPSLKRVVNGLWSAIPGMGAVLSIITIIFYVGAVMATKLFGTQFPEWFGSIDKSAYSLFQVMTLESWSMGIVRPVMEVYPYAWIFFVPFILVTTFTMLNLFIAVIVNAMQAETEADAADRSIKGESERQEILKEISLLRKEISKIQKS
jgi:voltage-gated sodium channel